MKKSKNIIVTGMVVAAVMVAGVSVYASTDVVEEGVAVVREKLGFAHKGHHGGEEGKDFSAAVEAGVITQEEADDIHAYNEENRPDQEALKDELEGLTKEEVRAYMEANYPRSEDPLGDLVEEGLLTEDQAEKLIALRPEKGIADGEPGKGGRNSGGLEAAVDAGIITQEEADDINAYMEANRPDQEALKDELEGLTKEEVKAYMEANYPRPEDPIGDLVEEGLLTEGQADEIKALREELDANRPVRPEGGRPERSEDGSGRSNSMRPTSEDGGIAR